MQGWDTTNRTGAQGGRPKLTPAVGPQVGERSQHGDLLCRGDKSEGIWRCTH
jgi:hypothetical protein